MAILDVTSANSVLKEYYSSQRVEKLIYKDRPLFALLKKMKNFEGRNYPVPIQIGLPQGRSNTFANAQAAKSPSVYREFLVTRKADYALASIATEAILASRSDAGAFLRLATNEIDSGLMTLQRSLAWAAYGSGSGKLGQVSASLTSGTVITLTNAEDIVRFEVNQILNVWSAETAGTQRTYDGTNFDMTITAIDRGAGTVTLAQTFTGSSTVAANDYLFVKGDRGASVGNKLSGLLGWLPVVAPVGGDNFYGVDRSTDTYRLAGVRYANTGKPYDEIIVDAARRVAREGGNPDTLFVSFNRYAQIEKTLGSRVVYTDAVGNTGNISFKGLQLMGPKGPIVIVPDQDCPDAYGFLLQMDTWMFMSLGEPVTLQDLDGLKMLRDSASDSYEVRMHSFSNMGCTAPGWNCVITW